MIEYICHKITSLDNKSLLEAEIEWAQNQDRIKTTPCKTLVLLVGLSPDPLLQSVYVYRPEKIVLILNEEGYYTEQLEEWTVFARNLIELVERLYREGLIDRKPLFLGKDGLGYPAGDDPKEVFKTLVEVLHEEEGVIIDITGGKKSMVTGAFLYAAYSGIPISYVDFGKYNVKARRPYGYTCKIGELANPYREFALREWERVRELYNRYQFEEASKLLASGIAETMREILPESVGPIEELRAYLDYYAKWDRGDFRAAKEAAVGLDDFEQPTAVVELGDKWYRIEGDHYKYKIKAEDFFDDQRIIRVYVMDELARIRRLIENGDYRSAFVRAGGVNEILMVARVIALITDKRDKEKFLEGLNKETPSTKSLFKALIEDTVISVKKRFERFFKVLQVDVDIQIPNSYPMKAWWQKTSMFNTENGWEDFLQIRNELMHKYFSVPRSWAEGALRFVEANFEDFLGHPIGELKTGEQKIYTEALPWLKLCELCGLSPFLPHGLR
ncbi:MAG: CRISPR-associated protein [Firmicutes bacterium]|nr:CRISPR-associated protein [Bacillota bacterium]